MPESQEISRKSANYWQTHISDAFKEPTEDDSVGDYIVHVTLVPGKRGSIKGWGKGAQKELRETGNTKLQSVPCFGWLRSRATLTIICTCLPAQLSRANKFPGV